MRSSLELEQMQVTRAERLLAIILAAFVLTGGLWIYAQVDEVGRPNPLSLNVANATQTQVIATSERADRRLAAATAVQERAAQRLEIRREAYRTVLDSGRPAEDLRQRYEAAQSAFDAAERTAGVAAADSARAAGPAQSARAAVGVEQARRQREFDRASTTHERITFAFRSVYVLASLALAYWWFGRVRRRRARLASIALALVAAAAVQVLVMATDYGTDYFDPLDLGPIVLSVVGAAMTVGAIFALQRYVARRVPGNRVRRNECPFCGYPVRSGAHCEGCGRDVVGSCSSCGAVRRVGTPHCASCGIA